MAYALDFNRQEDEENQGQPQALTSESQTIEPGTPQTFGGVASPSPQNKGGSQFPDVSRYLKQNEAAGNRLASKVGGNVVKAGSEVRQKALEETGKLNEARQNFNQGVNANTLTYNPDVVNRAVSNPTSFFSVPQRMAAPQQPVVMRDPGRGGGRQPAAKRQAQAPVAPFVPGTPNTTPFQVADEGGLNAFIGQRDAAYKGPTSLGYDVNYDPINSAFNTATGTADKAKTDIGRLDLLRNLYGGRSFSPETLNFDNLLLRGGGAQNILRNAAGQNADLSGLAGNLRSQEAAAKADALARGQSETANAADIRNRVAQATGGLIPSMQSDYAQRKEDYLDSLRGANKRRNAGEIATQDELDRIAALNQLLGTNSNLY